MAFMDVLLSLTSYPEPTPVFAVEDAVSVAAVLGAHIAALSCEINVELPGHFISGSMVGLPGIIAGEAVKSRRNAQDLVAAFEAAGAKAGVSRESILQKCKSFEVPDLLVEYARLRDLTIMPVPDSYDQWYAEAVIFGSGTIPPIPARDCCGGLGFQPRGRSRDRRCRSDPGKGTGSTDRNSGERESPRQQAFGGGARQESVTAWH
jgi:hypothetical protein